MADGTRNQGRLGHIEFSPVTRRDVRLASNRLVYRRPDFSYSGKVRQSSGLKQIAIVSGVAGIFWPEIFISLAFIGLFGLFTLLIAMRAALSVRGWMVQKKSTSALRDPIERWPTYSVLVPLYKEAASLPKLAQSLTQLNYPADKLEVMLLIEEDDSETIAAVKQLDVPNNWKVFVLPDGKPRTKPRALNVALHKLTGQIVTIYDAEDHPHPDQLKTAALALRDGGSNLACVQAPLRAYNANSSWIAGHWGLEYDIQFGLILPALARAGRPIALGGTSNHFRVLALRDVSGWDAWNVTEDADLGLRFARHGYRIGTIAPPTHEEAPEDIGVWLPQRSRWIKGYMQSAAVLWRRPLQAFRQMGPLSFLSSQVLLVGAIASACLHGPLFLFCMTAILLPGLALSKASIALLLAGYFTHCLAVLLSPGRINIRRILLMLSAPFYWPLQSVAAARAVYELAKSPHAWSKTPHALTKTEVPPFHPT